MGLSCKDELYRLLRVVDNFAETVKILEQQVRPLISSETPCKSDGQNIIPQSILYGNDLTWRIMVGRSRIRKPFLDLIDKFFPQSLPYVPYIFIGDTVYTLKAGFVIVVRLERFTEYLRMDSLPLVCSPGRIMHTVGNIAHMKLLRHISRPHIGENIFADLPVEP